MRRCLGLSLLVFCAASAGWADEKKPASRGAKFVYPGANETTGIRARNVEYLRFATKDGFEKVIDFYEKATGEKLRVGKPGTVSLRTNRVLIDDSKGRPVQERVFVHFAPEYYLTVVISRAKDEDRTHIALVFREREAKKAK